MVETIVEVKTDRERLVALRGKLFTNFPKVNTSSRRTEVYILCQVEYQTFCLVNWRTGNRFRDATTDYNELMEDMTEVKGWELSLEQIIE